jgi:hypothetical protein
MSQEMDFKKLQQRTYESYHQDGLIDIIFVLGFIGFGLNMALDNSAFLFMGWCKSANLCLNHWIADRSSWHLAADSILTQVSNRI